MALNPMPCKILLNAEPFGFGPTAAIASFFPYLKGQVSHIAYIGAGHSLNLQESLPYQHMIESSHMDDNAIMAQMKHYDVFVTAMDFHMAALAKQAGLKVIIYDALTWFWNTPPQGFTSADLYVAQDFIGVKNKLKNIMAHPNSVTVPPILQHQDMQRTGEHVLLNFGGLIHPFWSLDDATLYADKCYKAVVSALPKDEKLIVSASAPIAQALPHMNAKSYSREQMIHMLQKSKYAFMTSGLGNIYDAAQFNLPTLWLPPSNDSQGMQLELIEKEGMVDASIPWQALGMNITYSAPKQEVINTIQQCTQKLDVSQLSTTIKKIHPLLCRAQGSKTHQLIQTYGTGGAAQTASEILKFIQEVSC